MGGIQIIHEESTKDGMSPFTFIGLTKLSMWLLSLKVSIKDDNTIKVMMVKRATYLLVKDLLDGHEFELHLKLANEEDELLMYHYQSIALPKLYIYVH